MRNINHKTQLNSNNKITNKKNTSNIKTNITKKSPNNNPQFDIYDPKNAVEFNRQFLGLNNNGKEDNGMFAGEGIFNMNLPMHRPGEVPDFSNPYGNNFYGNKKGTGRPLNPRTQPLEYLQQFFGGFGIEFPVYSTV